MTLKSGTVTNLFAAMGNNAAADDVRDHINAGALVFDGMVPTKITQQVTLTNAVKTDLTTQLPANSVVLLAKLRLDELAVGDASGDDLFAKVGLGTAADPDLYGLTAALTANSKATTIPPWAEVTTATTVSVYACKSDGSAATEKFVAGSLVTVELTYLVASDLADYSA